MTFCQRFRYLKHKTLRIFYDFYGTKVNPYRIIMIKQFLSVTLIAFISLTISAQETAVINGNFETNVNIFLRDSSISAVSQPQYQNQFYGGEAWLNLSYAINGFTAGIRFDMFNNSNLPDPNGSYTDQGVGRWFVKKDFEKFSIQVGNLYDQIGSGIIFRSYEQRPLFIDNAVLGASMKYNFTDNVSLKGFVGRQKNAFDLWGGNLKGLSLETFYMFGEESPLTIAPGVGFVNKTISEEAMDKVVQSIKNYSPEYRFKPVYNNYAFTFFNTLGYKGFNWYMEAAYKTKDIFFNPEAIGEIGNSPVFGILQFKPGSVLYSSLSFAKGKLGLTLEGKRTENFVFRMDPSARLLRGLISFIPPMTRVNTYRLTARYSPATQEISEQAVQFDASYRWNKKLNTNVNFSNITTLDGDLLYREIYTEANYKFNRKLKVKGGLQFQTYNQEVYEVKPEVPLVQTVTPFLDILYKFNRKNALRFETQYMKTDEDFGSWFFALAEFSMAPHWIFEVSGMYNVDPKKKLSGGGEPEKILYPTIGAVYVNGSNRFQLRYVKQVEGIVCSGGICRLEPAFSGVRFSFSSNF
jgi:hypothetical protein